MGAQARRGRSVLPGRAAEDARGLEARLSGAAPPSEGLDPRIARLAERWAALAVAGRVLCAGARGPEVARELEGEGIDVAPAGASDAARAVIAPSLAEAASVDAVLAAVPASVARAVLLVPLSPSGEAARAPWLEACARSGLSPVAPFDWSEVGKGVVHLARAGGAGATVDLLLDEVEALRARDGARRALERRAVEAEGRLRQVERSVGWRLLSAIRGLRARLAPPDSRIDGFYRALRRIAGEVLERGVRASLRHPVRLLRGPEGAYARWRAREERSRVRS